MIGDSSLAAKIRQVVLQLILWYADTVANEELIVGSAEYKIIGGWTPSYWKLSTVLVPIPAGGELLLFLHCYLIKCPDRLIFLLKATLTRE